MCVRSASRPAADGRKCPPPTPAREPPPPPLQGTGRGRGGLKRTLVRNADRRNAVLFLGAPRENRGEILLAGCVPVEKRNSRALSKAPSVSVRQASCFQEAVMPMVQTVKAPGAPNRNPVSLRVPGSERQTLRHVSCGPGRFSALDGDTLTMHDTILPAHRSTPSLPPPALPCTHKGRPFQAPVSQGPGSAGFGLWTGLSAGQEGPGGARVGGEKLSLPPFSPPWVASPAAWMGTGSAGVPDALGLQPLRSANSLGRILPFSVQQLPGVARAQAALASLRLAPRLCDHFV